MSTNKGPEEIYPKLAKVVKRNQIINTKQCVSFTEKYRQRVYELWWPLAPLSAGRRSESSQLNLQLKKKKR